MNVALAGGTGFIGKVVLQKLIDAGHHVKALIRPGSLLKINKFTHTESRYVYYDSPSQMVKNVEDCQAVINIVGIIKETKETSFDLAHHIIPMSLADAARKAGIKRFISISALGVGQGIDTGYFESKELGENAIKSILDEWTIFRPSMVFGPEDKFFHMLAKMIRLMPFYPVVGDGQYRYMPVYVGNLADGFVQALEKPDSIGKTLDVTGPDTFTFDEMLDAIGQVLGKKQVAKVHLPFGLVKLGVRLLGPLAPGPVSVDAIKMLVAGSTSDGKSFYEIFDTQPVHFAEGIREYLKK
jgi:uncharacterized protein YbjT (DUF2867 family)